MPTVIVNGPPVDIEVKRKLVSGINAAASEAYGIPHITVLIREVPPENVGINGELLADRRAKHSAASDQT